MQSNWPSLFENNLLLFSFKKLNSSFKNLKEIERFIESKKVALWKSELFYKEAAHSNTPEDPHGRWCEVVDSIIPCNPKSFINWQDWRIQ